MAKAPAARSKSLCQRLPTALGDTFVCWHTTCKGQANIDCKLLVIGD
jgi:hypothetical protein